MLQLNREINVLPYPVKVLLKERNGQRCQRQSMDVSCYLAVTEDTHYQMMENAGPIVALTGWVLKV